MAPFDRGLNDFAADCNKAIIDGLTALSKVTSIDVSEKASHIIAGITVNVRDVYDEMLKRGHRLKVVSFLGFGSRHCVLRVTFDGKEHALRLYIDKGNTKSDLAQFRTIKRLFERYTFFPTIEWESKHRDTFWTITPIYVTHFEPSSYLRSMVDIANAIHSKGYCYFDWKTSNLLYDTHSECFKLVDLDMINVTKSTISQFPTRRLKMDVQKDPFRADALIVLLDVSCLMKAIAEAKTKTSIEAAYWKHYSTPSTVDDLKDYFTPSIRKTFDEECQRFIEQNLDQAIALKGGEGRRSSGYLLVIIFIVFILAIVSGSAYRKHFEGIHKASSST